MNLGQSFHSEIASANNPQPILLTLYFNAFLTSKPEQASLFPNPDYASQIDTFYQNMEAVSSQ